jgi:hypothetical protein
VRRTLALVGAAACAALAALILGEYELTLWTAIASGVIVGFLVAEVVLIASNWRGRVPAAAAGVLAAGSIWWAAWISSGRGLEPIRATAWAGVALAFAVSAYRLFPRRRPAR